jgi:ubiquinone/menaquinone biosynthesis C-methylase UbiE
VADIRIVSAREKFDYLAPTYDDAAEYYMQWDGEAMMDMLGTVSGKHILDVGCGTGRLIARLERSGADTIGIDISERMVEKAKSKSLLVFQSDINEFIWNEQFDVIVSVLTFNYIKDKKRALQNIWYLMKLGGLFTLCSDLEKSDVPVKMGEELVASEYFPLSKDGYWRLLVEMGFDIKDSVDLFTSESERGVLQPYEIIGFIVKAQKTHEMPEDELRA